MPIQKFVLLLIFLAAFITAQFTSANAKDAWQIEKLQASSLPPEIVVDGRRAVIAGLPDGRIDKGQNGATIDTAWYGNPTARYGHAILGDGIEGGSLVAIDADGNRFEHQLSVLEVFEDITPRLDDLDGDGKTEIVTIISSVNEGASLGIFQIISGKLQRVAQSPYIGRAHRWLNIAGIEHYSGAKTREVALVVTPHIGGRLDLFRFAENKLQRIASRQGYSNHVIASREQRLSASYPSDVGIKINLALPSASRGALRIMSMGADGWRQLGNISLPAPIDKAIGVTGSGKNVKFTVGLSDGSVYSIFQH